MSREKIDFNQLNSKIQNNKITFSELKDFVKTDTFNNFSNEEKEYILNLIDSEDFYRTSAKLALDNNFCKLEKKLTFNGMSKNEVLLLDEVNEKTECYVGRIYEASRINRKLYEAKYILKDIASICYHHPELKFSNGRGVYNSLNYYKGVIGDTIEAFSDVKCLGLAVDDHNTDYKKHLLKDLSKLNGFLYRLEIAINNLEEKDRVKIKDYISSLYTILEFVEQNISICNFFYSFRDEYGGLFDVPGIDFELDNLLFTDSLAPDLAEVNEGLLVALPIEE